MASGLVSTCEHLAVIAFNDSKSEKWEEDQSMPHVISAKRRYQQSTEAVLLRDMPRGFRNCCL